MYVSQLIFKLMVILCCSILRADGSRKDDFSKDEKLLEEYFKHKNELKWAWSVNSFCRAFRPRACKGVGDTLFSRGIQKQEIVLEAPGCVKMEVETLTCWYTKRNNSRNVWRYRKPVAYVSGLNGEIYKLGAANGICNDFKTSVITDRIHGGDSTSASPQQSKLLGVARVFETVNAVRAKACRRSEDRSGNNISDSDEDADNFSSGASTSNRSGNPQMVFHVVRM